MMDHGTTCTSAKHAMQMIHMWLVDLMRVLLRTVPGSFGPAMLGRAGYIRFRRDPDVREWEG
jgi:hypothetical protein